MFDWVPKASGCSFFVFSRSITVWKIVIKENYSSCLGKYYDVPCNAFHTFITDYLQKLENFCNFQVDFHMFCTLEHYGRNVRIRSFSRIQLY